MIFRFLVSAALSVFVAIAPQTHAAGDTVGSSGPSKTFVYKKTKQAELAIVVHFPSGWKASDRRAAIVFFFGGGWTNGKLSQFEPQATALAARGLVTARADYRVKSRHGVSPDVCVEDAKSAVRWLRQNASMLGIDPNRIIAAGGSAGGHIAACTALTDGLEAPGEDLRISSRPNAMILFNPVLRLDHLSALVARVGHNEKLAKQISPNLHISKETPPTLLFFGDQDPLMHRVKSSCNRQNKSAAGRSWSRRRTRSTATSITPLGPNRRSSGRINSSFHSATWAGRLMLCKMPRRRLVESSGSPFFAMPLAAKLVSTTGVASTVRDFIFLRFDGTC